VAFDISGNDNDGTINGTPNWIPGVGGSAGALEFDGTDDYVGTGKNFLSDLSQFSIALWVAGDPSRASRTGLVGQNDCIEYGFISGNTIQIWTHGGGAMNVIWPFIDLDWHHVAAIGDGSSLVVYIDGEERKSGGYITNNYGSSTFSVNIGGGGVYDDSGNCFAGWIDDVRTYNHALTEIEVQIAMNSASGKWPFALGPVPEDGATHPNNWANLSWTPGGFAASHDVFFSDNFDDVNAGAEGVFHGNRAASFFVVGFPGSPFPDGLVPSTTYYWRIDEINDAEPNSPWEGDVWSFMIPPKTAYSPEPFDTAESIAVDVDLSWAGGLGAKSHTVYFGDKFDDVSNATGGFPQSATTFTPGPLEWVKTYYWRVDEFDGVDTYKGNVWSFTTEGNESVLQFKSGFEPDTYILGDKIKGIDNSGPPGANSWDNLSDYLPWVLTGDGYFEGGSMEISADPFNSANHVLHLHTFQNDRAYARSQWSLEQVHNWSIEGKPNLFEQQFYRFRMLIPNRISTLYSYDEKSRWYMIWESHTWEFENTRHGIYIGKEANSNEWNFLVVQRYPGSSGPILYNNEIYRDVVVPMGEWFTFKIFFKYHETEGEFYASIKRDGQPQQTIADFKGQTKFGTKLHDQMMFKLYHDEDYIDRTSALGLDGIHQYYDDFEIWSDYPGEKR
jgi:hypothetical protein